MSQTVPVLPVPYRVLRALAKGGQGSTWLVYDEEQGQQVVVKIAPTSIVDHEAVMLAQVHSDVFPRLLTTFSLPGMGEKGMVMEFIEGVSLEQLIQQFGPQSPSLVRRWAIALGHMLYLLHSCQPAVIHRDIKPANVMLRPGGTLALVDFGIARIYKAGQQRDTENFGSLGYVSPEQTGKAQTDARSDLYSLAATLTHCLTGYDLSLTPWQPPSLVGVSDPVFVALIEAALNLDPLKRPQSAADWLQRLGEPIPIDVAAPGAPHLSKEGSILLPVPGGGFLSGPTSQYVFLSAFSLAREPITVGQWRRYIAAGGSGLIPDGTLQDSLPMAGLSWIDADQYCRTFGLRLPTAQEWEKAARGIDGRRYPWGNVYQANEVVAKSTAGSIQPVATRGTSPFGQTDMLGNIWEWTAPCAGLSAIACGGCYRNEGDLFTCWTQQRFAADVRQPTVGFRVAQ